MGTAIYAASKTNNAVVCLNRHTQHSSEAEDPSGYLNDQYYIMYHCKRLNDSLIRTGGVRLLPPVHFRPDGDRFNGHQNGIVLRTGGDGGHHRRAVL
jgi:hypothetical protein